MNCVVELKNEFIKDTYDDPCDDICKNISDWIHIVKISTNKVYQECSTEKVETSVK